MSLCMFVTACFVLSRFGKKLIKIGDYTFYLLRVIGPKTHWRCSTHSSKGCKAAISTIEEQIISIKNVHNH